MSVAIGFYSIINTIMQKPSILFRNEGFANKTKLSLPAGRQYEKPLTKTFCAFRGGLRGVCLKNHGNRRHRLIRFGHG